MMASEQGLRDTVQRLLTAGVKVDLTNAQGFTALMLACSNGHEDVASVLVSPTQTAGALELRCSNGHSAFLWAKQMGLVRVMEKLCMCGVAHELIHPAILSGKLQRVQLNAKERVVVIHKADDEDWGLNSHVLNHSFDAASACLAQRISFREIVDLRAKLYKEDGFFSTVRSNQRCPVGARGYYEIEILKSVNPSFGFCTAAFGYKAGMSSQDQLLGEDEKSWSISWLFSTVSKKHNGKAVESAMGNSWGNWKAGDVLGLACDLVSMKVFVSLNGNFTSPFGLMFDLEPTAVCSGLFAVFSDKSGSVFRYNMGESPFRFSAPSVDLDAETTKDVSSSSSPTLAAPAPCAATSPLSSVAEWQRRNTAALPTSDAAATGSASGAWALGQAAFALPSSLTVSPRAPPIVLRVRTNLDLRVQLDRSLSSDQVGTLRTGAAFAFHEVGGGWAKLSPLHYTDLQTSISCNISDFKPHDPETHGYCFTAADGQESFEETSDEEKSSVLARFAVTEVGRIDMGGYQGFVDFGTEDELEGACIRKELDMVQVLARCNADINAIETSIREGLMVEAIASNRGEIVKLLAHSDLCLDFTDTRGWTVLDMSEGKEDIFETLRAAGAQHSIFYAIDERRLDVLKSLVAAGAHGAVKNKEDKIGILLAIERGYSEAARMLIEPTACSGLLGSLTDEAGRSCLMLASSHRLASAVQDLLMAGARPEQR